MGWDEQAQKALLVRSEEARTALDATRARSHTLSKLCAHDREESRRRREARGLRATLDFGTGEMRFEHRPQKNPANSIQKTRTFGQEPANVRREQTDDAMLASLMSEQTVRGEIARRMILAEWTIADLARESGVDERTIRDLLRGKRKRGPHMTTKKALAHALGCTVGDLYFPGEGGSNGNDRSSNHEG